MSALAGGEARRRERSVMEGARERHVSAAPLHAGTASPHTPQVNYLCAPGRRSSLIQGPLRPTRGRPSGLARFWAAANPRPSHPAEPEHLAPRSGSEKIGERGRRAGLAARRSHHRRRPRRRSGPPPANWPAAARQLARTPSPPASSRSSSSRFSSLSFALPLRRHDNRRARPAYQVRSVCHTYSRG